jgi:hypothetical protein
MSNEAGSTKFAVFNTDLDNTLTGILERLFFVCNKDGTFSPTHQPKPALVFGRLHNFKRALVKRVGRRRPIKMDDVPNYYKGNKRNVYLKALQSLHFKPLARKDSYLNTFVKVEKTDWTVKRRPVPRIIQPRNPRYHLQLARYLKPIEHDIYSAINGIFGYQVVAKGKNAIQRGRMIHEAWTSFKNPVAIAADAKRFDQHVSSTMLSWEHSVYQSIFNNKSGQFLHKLLTWQKKNVGFANTEEGQIKYSINGCRMSGDINTSLGNVIIMCGMFYSWLSTKTGKARFINDGDDCVLIVEEEDLHQYGDLVEYFHDFGFTMELDEPVRKIEHINFCQCKPIIFPSGCRMVRNFEPCLSKDLHTTKCIRTEGQLRTQLRSVAECGLSIASDVPVFGPFYTNMLQQNLSGKIDLNPEIDGKFWLAQNMPKLDSKIHDITRASFYTAFGITPQFQIELERLYSAIPYPYERTIWTTHGLHL